MLWPRLRRSIRLESSSRIFETLPTPRESSAVKDLLGLRCAGTLWGADTMRALSTAFVYNQRGVAAGTLVPWHLHFGPFLPHQMLLLQLCLGSVFRRPNGPLRRPPERGD